MNLAERFPDVASTWHDVRNGAPATQISSTSSDSVWWLCPQKHEWQQTVASRTNMPAWKAGDRAACRECLGDRWWGRYECEHSNWFTTATDRDVALTRLCAACRKHAVQRVHAEAVMEETGVAAFLRALRSHDFTDLEDVIFDPHATPPLIGNWSTSALNHLARLRGRGAHLTRTMARRELEEVKAWARHLTPSPENLEEAIAENDLVSLPLISQRMWPAGWQWQRYAIPQPAAEPGEEVKVAGTIAEHITAWSARTAVQRVHWKTGELTHGLTGQIAQALRDHDPGGRVHREALIPLIRQGGSKGGFLDLVLCRTRGPDIVVELDSQAKPWSAHKLKYSRTAGALTVWVRFGQGPVSSLTDGTMVVDARDTVAALARGRIPPSDGVRIIGRCDPNTLFTP